MRQLTMETYIKHIQARYSNTKGRKAKSLILDDFCNMTGYTRNHAISVLKHRTIGWRERPLGRKKQYKPEQILIPLKVIWLATNQMCGKRLKEVMPLWLPHYRGPYGQVDEQIKEKLLLMSAATIDRLLKPLRVRFPKRLGGTKPGYLLKNQIPIKTDQWKEDRPGFVEGDTVAHCGTSLLGSFVWSLTVTDIYSQWTENAAMWNKGAHAAKEQIQCIEERLPFSLLGWDSDGGGEFLNYHLLAYFQERENPVQFTRSRAYHSCDNAHVEQKNWTHVRQLFGYDRFDHPDTVPLMNDLYRDLSLLQNYFFPAMKLHDKIRIQSKIKKIYDKPQTPYQRLMVCEHLSLEQKEKLKQRFDSLDPFKLKKTIDEKLNKIFSFNTKRSKLILVTAKSKKSSSF